MVRLRDEPKCRKEMQSFAWYGWKWQLQPAVDSVGSQPCPLLLVPRAASGRGPHGR